MSSSLQNIFSRSFPANHLFEVSLVKDTNPELAFYKPKYFTFVSLMPGAQTEQGGRTFNKDGRITLKTECEKLLSLSNSIKAYARGQNELGQFAIFVDSSKSSFGVKNGGFKSCFASEFVQKSQQQNGPDKKMISVSFKNGQSKPIGLFWSPPEALAVAYIIEFIGKKGIELEYEDRVNTVGRIQPSIPQPPSQQNSYQNQQPNQQNSYQNQQPNQQIVPTIQQNQQQNTNTQTNVVDNFTDAMSQNTTNVPDDLPF